MFLLEDYQILLTGVRLSSATGSSALLVIKHLIPKQIQSCTLARSNSLTTLRIGHVCDVFAMIQLYDVQWFHWRKCTGHGRKYLTCHKMPNIPMSCSLQNPFPLLARIIGDKIKSAYEIYASMLVLNIVKISNTFCSSS